MVDETRRRVLKLFGAAGALTGLGGAGMVTAQQGDDGDGMSGMIDDLSDGGVSTSRVRFGHFIPDGPAVDVYAFVPGMEEVGEVPINTNLDYTAVRPNIPAEYADVPAIGIGLKVTPAGKPDEPIVKIPEFDFEAGRNYTVLAIGEVSPELEQPMPQALALVDNEGEDPPGYGRTQLPKQKQTLVRFVHALADGGRVTVRSGGETLASGVRFGETTGYMHVDPKRPIRIYRSGELAKVITGGLRHGTAYSAYVAERTPEAGGFKPKVYATVDAVARPHLRTADSKGHGGNRKGNANGKDDSQKTEDD
ncbi:DUF4397 domain-containing protein [Halomarina litorea]|uniref:DUF4397 domain-containing protein n=1 Tax=Halomarina litorea TaxID=2961595 RepID=UPI0020C3C73F|nr:DUF4397 domain-containing protein [Halomarina sp. BCD28]